MMKFNQYVVRHGLTYLNANSLSYAICQTEPTTLLDCTGLSGDTGKRISSALTLTAGELTITEGANPESLDINIPDKTFQDSIQVAVTGGSADLWLVIYDGTQWLFKTNEIVDRDLPLGATVLSPSIKFGVQQ